MFVFFTLFLTVVTFVAVGGRMIVSAPMADCLLFGFTVAVRPNTLRDVWVVRNSGKGPATVVHLMQSRKTVADRRESGLHSLVWTQGYSIKYQVGGMIDLFTPSAY